MLTGFLGEGGRRVGGLLAATVIQGRAKRAPKVVVWRWGGGSGKEKWRFNRTSVFWGKII